MALTQISTNGITDGTIVNADVNGSAAIVGSKLADDSITEAKLDVHNAPSGTDKFLGYTSNGMEWTTVPPGGATLTGSTNNTITTVTGANAIQGEANLTYDGDNISQAIDANGEGIHIKATGNFYPQLSFNSNRSANNNTLGYLPALWNNTEVASISFNAGDDTTNKDNASIRFNTASAGSNAERMRIEKDGNVAIGTTSPGSIFHVQPLDETNFLVRNEGSNLVLASETNSGRDNNRGMDLEATAFTFIEGGSEKMRIDSNGLVGIGTDSPSSFSSGANNLVVNDASGAGGITIVTPNSDTGSLFFSDGTSATGQGRVRYDHSTDSLNFGTNGTGSRMIINSSGHVSIASTSSNSTLTISGGSEDDVISVRNTTGGNGNVGIYFSTQDHSGGREKAALYHQETHGQAHYGGDFIFCLNTATGGATRVSPSDERMRISASGHLSFQGDTDTFMYRSGTNTLQIKTNDTLCTEFSANQRVRMPQVYSTNGSSMNDVQIESDGTLCAGNTSIRASKKNILSLTDVSWLYDLNPVTFNYRKKLVDENTGEHTYLEEVEAETAYGLIAEEVESVRKDFCFYHDDKLSGVYYKQLITPLLKAIQIQKRELDALKAKVDAL